MYQKHPKTHQTSSWTAYLAIGVFHKGRGLAMGGGQGGGAIFTLAAVTQADPAEREERYHHIESHVLKHVVTTTAC